MGVPTRGTFYPLVDATFCAMQLTRATASCHFPCQAMQSLAASLERKGCKRRGKPKAASSAPAGPAASTASASTVTRTATSRRSLGSLLLQRGEHRALQPGGPQSVCRVFKGGPARAWGPAGAGGECLWGACRAPYFLTAVLWTKHSVPYRGCREPAGELHLWQPPLRLVWPPPPAPLCAWSSDHSQSLQPPQASACVGTGGQPLPIGPLRASVHVCTARQTPCPPFPRAGCYLQLASNEFQLISGQAEPKWPDSHPQLRSCGWEHALRGRTWQAGCEAPAQAYQMLALLTLLMTCADDAMMISRRRRLELLSRLECQCTRQGPSNKPFSLPSPPLGAFLDSRMV